MRKQDPSKKAFQFTSVLERSSNKLWGAHFRVPNRIVERLIDGDSRRVVCTLNDSAEYQCALLPVGEGTFVISVNKQLRDRLRLAFGIDIHVSLRKDKSEYGLPLPEEFREVLKQDPKGNTLFLALTRGRQRTLLYIVGSARSPEKRVARAITIVKHLKANGGKINYRQLGTMLKDPRRLFASG